MAKLKRMLTHPRRNESGQGALAMVLLLLMLGAVILTPLLVFMQTGLGAGRVYESKLQGFYAADSGIEDACCELLLPEENRTHFQGDDPSLIPPWNLSEQVNVMNVTLEWLDVAPLPIGGELHTVRSTAKLGDENKSIIVAQIEATSSLARLWENAITSKNDLTIRGGCNITGDVQYGGTLTETGKYDHTGEMINEEPEDWPTAAELSAFYLADVAGLTPLEGDQLIAINGTAEAPTVIGPLYCDGDLQLKGSGYAELQGTIYVTGKFSVKSGAAPNLILVQRDLNDDGDYEDGNETPTVYAEYAESHGEAIYIRSGTGITGSGNFIGLGDVKFQPSMNSKEGDFVFVMSVTGTLDFQPSGDFYGAVAGDVKAELSPGNRLINPDYGGVPHFPPGDPITRIITYSIEY